MLQQRVRQPRLHAAQGKIFHEIDVMQDALSQVMDDRHGQIRVAGDQTQDCWSGDCPHCHRFQRYDRTRIQLARQYGDVAKDFHGAQKHHGLFAALACHACSLDPARFQNVN